MSRSLLDPPQIIQDAYDDTTHSFRTTANVTLPPEQQISIDAQDDSIRLGDGTNLNTLTTVNAKVGIDVNLIGGVVSSIGLQTGLKAQALTITDVPTKIPNTDLASRNGMCVRVWGNAAVYFGASNVSAAQGYPKRQYEEFIVDIKDNASVDLYGVCDTGLTSEVRVFEIA